MAALGNTLLSDFPVDQLKLFDDVDEDFVACWHGKCAGRSCTKMTAERAVRLHKSLDADTTPQSWKGDLISQVSPVIKTSAWGRAAIQKTDNLITKQWLHCRLWQICHSHGLLLSNATDVEQRPAFALEIATQAYDCYSSVDDASKEAHGIGLIEKLFDVAWGLLQARKMLGSEDWLFQTSCNGVLDQYSDLLRGAPEDARSFADRFEQARRL